MTTSGSLAASRGAVSVRTSTLLAARRSWTSASRHRATAQAAMRLRVQPRVTAVTAA